jgi:hypothetical protein
MAALKLRPRKPTKVTFINTSVYHTSGKGTKSELKCSSILPATKIFMGIKGGDSTKCILTPKHFGKLS